MRDSWYQGLGPMGLHKQQVSCKGNSAKDHATQAAPEVEQSARLQEAKHFCSRH